MERQMDNQINTLTGNIDIVPLEDFHCLNSFSSGVESMDIFIRGDFRLSVEHHYCTAYLAKYGEEVVAVFALSFDSLDLDTDDKDELYTGMTSTGTPDIDWNYRDTFYAKPRYPALDIAYLAVQKEWRGKHIGHYLLEMIAEQARNQSFAGCQFLTVEILCGVRLPRGSQHPALRIIIYRKGGKEHVPEFKNGNGQSRSQQSRPR